MEKQPVTIVVGQGPVANAIAAQLAQAGQPMVQVALSGGKSTALPTLVTPKQIWSSPAEAALEPPQPAVVVESLKAELTPAGDIQITIDGDAPVVPARLIIASSRAAAALMPQLNLKLPIRPVRCHILKLAQPAPVEAVTYLSRGAIFHLQQDQAILYDGLLDPRQATFATVADVPVEKALQVWLAKRDIESAGAPSIMTTAATPDYLPAFGPWQGLSQLWLAIGWHVWGSSVAGSVAAQLAEMMLKGEVVNDIDISRLNPARFQIGTWQKVDQPAWLPDLAQPQLVGGPKEVTRADTVNTVDTPKVERAGTVKTTDTPNTQRATQVQTRSGKGKVQAAPIKGR